MSASLLCTLIPFSACRWYKLYMLGRLFMSGKKSIGILSCQPLLKDAALDVTVLTLHLDLLMPRCTQVYIEQLSSSR